MARLVESFSRPRIVLVFYVEKIVVFISERVIYNSNIKRFRDIVFINQPTLRSSFWQIAFGLVLIDFTVHEIGYE